MLLKGTYNTVQYEIALDTHETILYGDSGIGKTFIFKSLDKEYNGMNVYKYTYQTDNDYMCDRIKSTNNALFVLDRIELWLTPEMRQVIMSDKFNIFLIMGHDYWPLGRQEGSVKTLEFNDSGILVARTL